MYHFIILSKKKWGHLRFDLRLDDVTVRVTIIQAVDCLIYFRCKFLKMHPKELDSFIGKLKQLWQSGKDARLHVETHAGEAWASLHVKLGHGQGHQHQHKEKPHLPRNRNGPSRQRRRARRAAARQERAVEASADQNELENGFETAVESVSAEEALDVEEENKVVSNKSVAEESPPEKESESADKVTINDLMAFLKKSEEERVIERKEREERYKLDPPS